eukprot:m.196612 g.196612  ORF g.196612 m.196612 type:complete len:60 (-) comp15255_c1_seq1:55-234(-)
MEWSACDMLNVQSSNGGVDSSLRALLKRMNKVQLSTRLSEWRMELLLREARLADRFEIN